MIPTNNLIMKYLGTNYKYHGDSLEDGFDCINLCCAIGKDLGVYIPNINHSMFDIHSYQGLFDIRDNKAMWLHVQPKANTLCVFKINGKVQHVGYMLDDNQFIHIMEGSRVSVDTLDNIQWSRRLVGCYEYIGNIN